MGKIKENKHYLVAVTLRVEGYQKILLEGVFIPKTNECSVQKIKQQCWDFLKPNIDFEKYGIHPEQVKKKITVKSHPIDFWVNEDQL